MRTMFERSIHERASSPSPWSCKPPKRPFALVDGVVGHRRTTHSHETYGCNGHAQPSCRPLGAGADSAQVPPQGTALAGGVRGPRPCVDEIPCPVSNSLQPSSLVDGYPFTSAVNNARSRAARRPSGRRPGASPRHRTWSCSIFPGAGAALMPSRGRVATERMRHKTRQVGASRKSPKAPKPDS